MGVELGFGTPPQKNINDTITFGSNLSLSNFEFGSKDIYYDSSTIPTPYSGHLGVNNECFTGDQCDYYCTNILGQLVQQGAIYARAFSLLPPKDANTTGNLLFGGIDQAKRDEPVSAILYLPGDQALNNHVTFYTFYVTDTTGNETVVPVDPASYVFWDTNTPSWDLPLAGFQAVADYLQLGDVDPDSGYPFQVGCKFLEPTTASISIGFNDSPNFQVYYHELVYQLGPNDCWTAVRGATPIEDDDVYFIVAGGAFTRKFYLTFNLDARTISISGARYTDDESIVAITP
ncbi:hypothetical protein EIK77_000126 [Talaromyces pinophilus]|nr:hypothetical protein EIK77_000126 [Talaromyces pinophilus]PCG93994.1 Peptidase aspartic, catalytic [Penicillium occitanis (nom. inval.)]PCH04630.1 hypothetical protein PENOC_032890 [Penicillium occitanis (nom. inval.)]